MTMRGKNRNACAIIFLFCWFWWPWKQHYFFIEIIRFFKWCCRCYKLLNLLIICWSFPSQNCECCCNCKNSQLLTIELRSRVELQIYVYILTCGSFLFCELLIDVSNVESGRNCKNSLDCWNCWNCWLLNSGRELSYILLVGVLLCFGNTFLLLAKPCFVTCIFQRQLRW